MNISFKQGHPQKKKIHPHSPLHKRRPWQSSLGSFSEEQTKPFSTMIEEEVTSYEAAECLHVDADPFVWWKTNQSKFPHVAKLPPCCKASVSGESLLQARVFSTAGDIVSASRSRLALENVDMLIFLQKNLNMKE